MATFLERDMPGLGISLDLIHAGDETFPLAKGIRAVAAGRLLDDL